MIFARQLGYAVQQVAVNHELEICQCLGLTKHELNKLYKGRLFLTCVDLAKISDICGVSLESLVIDTPLGYQNEAAQLGFDNLANYEIILDLVDAYIDAKEILTAG